LNHQGFHVWGGGAGKVHGSLARAGKVRGQTPKVAKQDKKKKPTGRAHKRMQYNRRFVTAGTPQETSTFSSPVFFVFQAYTIWVRVFHLALEFFHVSLFCFDTRQCFSFLFFAVVGFGKKRGPNSSEK
jgi:ribosomal protein S30